MKELNLCRHAKSSWKYDTEDLYRPLNRRGINDAPVMARRWSGQTPDLILCSPAVRAYATALAYVHENQWRLASVRLCPELVDASPQTMLDLISETEDCDRLWVFGHNPGITLLAEFLTGEVIDNIVTGARASIHFDIEHWRQINTVKGQLVDINTPHDQSAGATRYY